MTQRDKAHFRRSPEWHAFKDNCYDACKGVDVISQEPLKTRWELHHLDMNESKYKAIGRTQDFVPLNNESHTLVHLLYPVYRAARKRGRVCDFADYIVRAEEILNQMYQKELCHNEEQPLL